MEKEMLLAWRNLWRNPGRTLITLSAVVLAVILSAFTSSMQEGTYARMIDNMVKFYTGYLQIHHPGYWASRSINDTFEPDSRLREAVSSTEDVLLAVPRLESFTLLSSGEHTKGCALIGIDPVKEDSLTRLSRWITGGHYLSESDSGLLLAVNLARSLGIQAGDTLVLLSQGYHGASASALMPVRGILKFPSPELNNFGAYISIRQAGDFFSAPGRVTSWAILVNDYHRVDRTARRLRDELEPDYSIMTWDEMQPDLVKMIEGDRAGAVLMKGILYLVVGFGMLGTVIMMMAERKKEMGVMIAIGMQKYRLQRMLGLESLLIGFLGVATGMVLSMPLLTWLANHPIPLPEAMAEAYEKFGIEGVLYFSVISKVFINQAITIFSMAMLVSLYPWFSIRGIRVIRALRGQ
jgi:ABC-type lipoprotein release transport system permease subunit